MSKISIPARVVPGFSVIASLTSDDLNKILKMIGDFKVTDPSHVLYLELSQVLGNEDANEFLNTIFSFSDLLDDDEDSVDIVKSRIIKSYEVTYLEEFNLDVDRLDKNLGGLLKNYEPLTLHLKFQNIYADNANNYLNSRILSDIKTLKHKNKIYGSVVNTIKLNYQDNQSQRDKSIYLSLDLAEMISFRSQLDEAINGYENLSKDFTTKII